MSFEEKHIGKSIKSKMDNFEIVPPEDVWDNIESTLLKNKAIVRRNKIIGIAGAMVLAALLVAFFSYYKKDSVKQDTQEIQPADSSSVSDTVISNEVSSSKVGVTKKDNFIQQNNPDDKNELKETNDIDTVAHAQIQPVSAIVDTVTENIPPVKKEVIKKVIKKPVYIVKQDTIYKVDTLSKKKKR